MQGEMKCLLSVIKLKGSILRWWYIQQYSSSFSFFSYSTVTLHVVDLIKVMLCSFYYSPQRHSSFSPHTLKVECTKFVFVSEEMERSEMKYLENHPTLYCPFSVNPKMVFLSFCL